MSHAATPQSLAISLTGLIPTHATPWPGGPREAIEWVAQLARSAGVVGGIQLDATMPGLRPRDLDDSARRDLASLIRRRGLRCTGVDFFIPPEHYTRPETQDRAHAALLAAIGLACSIGSFAGEASVTTQFPPASEALLHECGFVAERDGVVLGDASWPAKLEAMIAPSLRVVIDPALLLSAGEDPALHCARLAPHIASVRLSDASSQGIRVEAGGSAGRLKLHELHAAHLLLPAGTPLVVDVRGLAQPMQAVERILARLAR